MDMENLFKKALCKQNVQLVAEDMGRSIERLLISKTWYCCLAEDKSDKE